MPVLVSQGQCHMSLNPNHSVCFPSAVTFWRKLSKLFIPHLCIGEGAQPKGIQEPGNGDMRSGGA